MCNEEGKELKKLQEVYCEMTEKAKEIKERYNSCYQRYLDEQAGILALDLKEEQPCPVCGSTIHPQIAEIMKGAPTKEELEQLNRQSELAEATARDKSNICAQKQVHIKTIKEQIKKKIMKIWQVEQTLEEAANRCVMDKKEKEVQKQEVFAKLSEAKQRVFRFQKLEQSIPVINKQLENGQNQIHELTLKIKSALMEQQHLKKEIENLHGCMQYRSLQEAKKETTQKQLAIQKFNRESEYAKRQVELSNQELNTLMGKIDSLKEQVAATQTESYEGLHVRLEELLNSKAIVEEKYLQINER